MSEKGTEQATERRKQKAREKGDIVHSRELLSATSMLAGITVLGISARQFLSGWNHLYVASLLLAGTDAPAPQMAQAILRMFTPALLPVGLILVASFVAALLAGAAQSGGVQFHGEALRVKIERLNPVTNLGNIFSLRSAARMAKSLLPAALVVALGAKAVQQCMTQMPVLSVARLPATLSACYRLMLEAAWVMVAWSAVDYAVERVSWSRKLRMSKQEVRDELKETIGNPQIRGRIRQIQNAMRRRKVKADVARASVVVTNPTHYAVALEFSFETMQAPTVLAKGRNLHALRIREEAERSDVPIVENPPLARSLYKSVEEGQPIPYELYAAVAAILAFLYRQQVEKAARERKAAEAAAKVRTLVMPVPSYAGGGM